MRKERLWGSVIWTDSHESRGLRRQYLLNTIVPPSAWPTHTGYLPPNICWLKAKQSCRGRPFQSETRWPRWSLRLHRVYRRRDVSAQDSRIWEDQFVSQAIFIRIIVATQLSPVCRCWYQIKSWNDPIIFWRYVRYIFAAQMRALKIKTNLGSSTGTGACAWDQNRMCGRLLKQNFVQVEIAVEAEAVAAWNPTFLADFMFSTKVFRWRHGWINGDVLLEITIRNGSAMRTAGLLQPHSRQHRIRSKGSISQASIHVQARLAYRALLCLALFENSLIHSCRLEKWPQIFPTMTTTPARQ